MLKKFISILVLILFFNFTFAHGSEIKNVIIFGDSLSDNGNYFLASKSSINPMPLPPYYKGRATNGLVWAEYFTKSIQANLVDNAYLGALTSGNNPRYPSAVPLISQLDTYLNKLKSGKIDLSKTLFVVWAGSNNIFTMDFNEPRATLKSLWNLSFDVINSVKILKESGAKNILVSNLPDLGKIALNTDIEEYKKMSFFLTAVSKTENYVIKSGILRINEANKDKEFKLIFFDAEDMLTQIKKNPKKYNIKNIENACYVGVPSFPAKPNVACKNPQDYLFWDLVHPSTKIHCFAAIEIQKKLAENKLVKMPTADEIKKCENI
ncbi:SGNH/GDSL hydrolase family protein [Fluviispira multicolorata]|uniref:Phospholipase/lecithinase/hemolysin n=1 Tax=Fluviispira multicolorata TaxID=2654512 RepID=A0A833JFV1_9BACT|nr:SGNH/GDSL hydrolase family protein [Fluviispira multicolorata]KAB8031811.1 hypothetical protein GCL57_03990 [Fluviispira multicolorata]